jgi:hypothetical protein
MFVAFFKEIKWLLIIVLFLVVVLVGNVFYFMNSSTDIDINHIHSSHPHPHLDVSDEEEDLEGLEFKQLTENLYSLTGVVRQDDCEKIVPLLPKDKPFALILESGGGSLADGGCLAAHIKLRDVVTIIRDTPVLDENGKILYQPGLIPTEEEAKGKVICASACSLMFVGGDIRYLIGDVWLGIHSPRTPEEVIGSIGKRALESSAYRTSASLLLLLDQLGVKNERVKLLFIQVPSSTMYWLNPRDWVAMPALETLATHYINFWGYSAENVLPSTQ